LLLHWCIITKTCHYRGIVMSKPLKRRPMFKPAGQNNIRQTPVEGLPKSILRNLQKNEKVT